MTKTETSAQLNQIEKKVIAVGNSQRAVINGHEVRASLHDDSDGQHVAFYVDGLRCNRRGLESKIVSSVGGWLE